MMASRGNQMANRFTVRVELHHADENDYERLHERMGKNGFSKKSIFRKTSVMHFQLPNTVTTLTRKATNKWSRRHTRLQSRSNEIRVLSQPRDLLPIEDWISSDFIRKPALN